MTDCWESSTGLKLKHYERVNQVVLGGGGDKRRGLLSELTGLDQL
jgi:hypothetical protein